MTIGKTSSSISKVEVFTKYSEAKVVSKVFPEIDAIPCRISSPFRVDEHPSFSIFMGDNNHIYYKDFGDSNEKGSLLDLLCKYWKCTFNQCLDKILEIMADEEGNDVEVKSTKQIKTLTRKEANEASKIQVAVRPWRDYDYEYWASYGVNKKLLKWANIHPISHKIVTKGGKRYIFPADKLAYAMCEYKDGKLSLKIYQPLNKKGFKWCSKMDSSVWGLWTKVPQTGDNLIIGSSVKDCLNVISQLGIPAICMQGEGYWPKPQIMEELKSRYKRIIVFFDNDYTSEKNPGRTDSIKLTSEFGLERVEIPAEYEAKDPSDAYKKYGKEKYLEIMHSILDPVLLKDSNKQEN